MKVIETHPREIGFVLWGHCQNLLDDPRTNTSLVKLVHICSNKQQLLLVSKKMADDNHKRGKQNFSLKSSRGTQGVDENMTVCNRCQFPNH